MCDVDAGAASAAGLAPVTRAVPWRNYLWASTRFNNDTYAQQVAYRQKLQLQHRDHHCRFVYGCSRPLADWVPQYSRGPAPLRLLVCEMNNDRNCIEGIGLLQVGQREFAPRRVLGCRPAVYADARYNRYCYGGRLRLDRAQLLADEAAAALLLRLERRMFYGKGNCKRHAGVTVHLDAHDRERLGLPALRPRRPRRRGKEMNNGSSTDGTPWPDPPPIHKPALPRDDVERFNDEIAIVYDLFTRLLS